MIELDPATFSRAVNWLALATPWTPLALLSYAATVTVGTLSLRGHRVRRVWHTRLFVLTCILTAAALILSLPDRWGRALALALALAPLAALPFLGRRVMQRPTPHVLTGLAAAPCYLAALVLWAADPQ